MFIGGVLGYIGARIANIIPPLWFSITYLLLAFSIAGGISRSIAIGSGALNYLIRNAGLNPLKLVLTLTLASIVIQLSIFPIFMILISSIYYIFDKIILMINNVELMVTGIVLAALFTSSLAIIIGLGIVTQKKIITKLVNAIPSLMLCIYITSLAMPYNIQKYNPITGLITLISESFYPTTIQNLTTPIIVILASIIVMIIISITLTKKLTEIDIYDIILG
ncbi:MAG: hypothetical protein GXO23_03320 [Crenarchaeota archaeon]|nr:hypothetical protein [Thermoproteota archaeon]